MTYPPMASRMMRVCFSPPSFPEIKRSKIFFFFAAASPMPTHPKI